MLVVTRKQSEAITVGDDVEAVVLGIQDGRVKLGIAAPPGVRIRRNELSVYPDEEAAEPDPGDRHTPAVTAWRGR